MIETGGNIPQDNTIVVVGNSMSPTLRALDIVTVSTNYERKIYIGDVIVFPSPRNNQKVVHRVISIDPKGIVTRGDNNINNDKWVINSGDVIGKVENARRGSRRLKIYNGVVGQLIGQTLFIVNIFFFYIKRFFYPIYRTLWQSGIIKTFLPKSLKPKVLSFKRPNGIELQLVMGCMVIGRCLPASERWVINTPFRLFVDEEYLEKIRVSNKTLPTKADDYATI